MDAGAAEPPPAAEPRGRPLLGRSAEQAVIELLQQPDHAGALLIWGPAGIGKSALVNDAIRRAGRSRRVLRATGTPFESGLEFAALHQLLRPVMARAGAIPAARRATSKVAFGLADGTAPQRYAVAMAALELLAEAAAGQPLLVAAEDIHWMDPATVTVLAFISRRLEFDSIVLLATVRDDVPRPFQDPAMTVLELAPLTEQDSRELLATVAPGLGSRAQRRILTGAAGNPLALIELSRGAGGTPGGADDTGWLPLSTRRC